MDWRDLAVYGGAALLTLGAVLALPAMIPRWALWRRASRFTAAGGGLICLASAIAGWARTGRAPVGSAAEMLQFVGPGIVLAYLAVEGLAKSREAGLPALLLAAILAVVGYRGSVDPALAGELPLSMQSRWLPFYAASGFLAYGFLFMGAVQAAAFLVTREFWPGRSERAGRAVYWSVCLGFPFLLWSMMMAAVWSYGARGSLWLWTGRELWSLTYCLALVAYLNLHFASGWRERRAAWFLVVISLLGVVSFARMRELPTSIGDRSVEALEEPASSSG